MQQTYSLPSAALTRSYVPFPAKISKQGRDSLLASYPALSYHPHAEAYLRMVEYLIFSRFEDDEGRLIVPATTIEKIVRGKPIAGKRHFAAADWLSSFSQDVWRLDVCPHNHWEGEARTIIRGLPQDVQDILEDEPLHAFGETEGQVWFVTGILVTRKKMYAEAATYTEALKMLADGVGPDHPAHALMAYLNNQPQTTIGKIIKANWPRVLREFDAMPEGASREAAQTTLLVLRDYCKMIYAASEKTPRLHALGATIHQLPRALRKAALHGCVSLDARACQLAVVAKLWDVPRVSEFLSSRQSIWTELLSAMGVGPDVKPLVKEALYSIIFGMKVINVRCNLLGLPNFQQSRKRRRRTVKPIKPVESVNEKAADAFLTHPLIAELLAARQARLREIKRDRHIVDAFGRRIDYNRRYAKMRSLLAQEVQSYEVALMLSLLPIFEAERNLVVVSWLHDGITVHVTDTTQRERIVRRLQATFSARAASLGLLTTLEPE
jgi:hypothetical protein